MPSDAHLTLAEGEFNRFYARAICLRALAGRQSHVRVYRARPSANPRPESEALVGQLFEAQALLEDLRSSPGVDTALGLASGLGVEMAEPVASLPLCRRRPPRRR